MHSQKLKWLPRIGYIAKGVVYVIVGGLALMSAVGYGGSTGGSKSALQAVIKEPFGMAMVAVLALGLACYAGWRWVQLFLDPEDKSDDDSIWLSRVIYAASAISHTTLTIYAVMLLIGATSSSDSGGDSKAQWTAWIMEYPGGRLLVGAFGLAVVAVGGGEFTKVIKQSHLKKLSLDRHAAKFRAFIKGFGSFGLAARGVIFVVIGGLFVYAAWTFDADQAAGVGDAMRKLREQPFGAWLFGAIAAGLVCYGAFQVIKGLYRRIKVT